MLGIETDDVDDVEIGARVRSRSYQDAYGHRGGVVVEVVRDDGDDSVLNVTVVERVEKAGPVQLLIERNDIDLEALVTGDAFFTADARLIATQLFAWLGDKKARPEDMKSMVRWSLTAAALADAASGQYLPGAEHRYKQWLRSRRAS